MSQKPNSLLNLVKKRWQSAKANQSFWTLVDQCVVSLGNFFTSILIARNISPADYGVYALILGMLIFLNGIHASIIVYPLLVRGAGVDRTSLRQFASASVLFLVILALPLSVGVIGITGAVGRLQLAPWVFGALFLWQFQETTRRALMAHLRYREAIWGDAISYLGQAILVWAVFQGGRSSLEIIFGIMLLTSAVAGGLQAIQLGLKSVPLNKIRHFALDFWQVGRWMLYGSLTNLAINQAVPWTLAYFHGTQTTGTFQAMINIVGLVNPVLASINNLIVPGVAHAYAKTGLEAAQKTSLNYAFQGGVFVIPYYTLLLLCPHWVIQLFYGSHSPYLGAEIVLCLLAVNGILDYPIRVGGGFLAGLGKSRATFVLQCVTIPGLFVGVPLAALGGIVGSLIAGIVVGELPRLAFITFFLRRLQHKFARS